MAGGPFITEKKRKKVIKLYNSTVLTQVEIAEALRISQNSVSRVLKEYRYELRTEMDESNPSSN